MLVFATVWYLGYARSQIEEPGLLAQYVLERSGELPDVAVSATTSIQPEGDSYRVMVPLANPASEHHLITLGSAIADQHDGTVVAVNIVDVPDQTTLEAARSQQEFDAAHHLLDQAQDDAETYGAAVETHVVLSHQPFEEIFNAAERYGIDTCVMGWGPESHGAPGRAETTIDELAHSLPCDFLVFKDRGFDPSRVLVPTAGGPDSELTGAIARTLREQFDAAVTLLHVAEDRDKGTAFLRSWAADNNLSDAELRVSTGDVQTQIAEAATGATLLIIGVTGRGVLSRLVRGSLVLDVLDDVECSVLLAEKYHKRTLRERLFETLGRGERVSETGVEREPTTPTTDSSSKDETSTADSTTPPYSFVLPLG